MATFFSYDLNKHPPLLFPRLNKYDGFSLSSWVRGLIFFKTTSFLCAILGSLQLRSAAPSQMQSSAEASGVPCRIRVSAPCVLHSLLLVIPCRMAFLSSAAAALGGWLMCREQPTLTLSSFQEYFPSQLFSFGTTFIWPFMSIGQLSKFSLTDLFFFFWCTKVFFLSGKHSPQCSPSCLVFPTNFIGIIVWWAPLLMEMLVNMGTQHHWNILCFDSVQWELLLQLGVQPPFSNSVHPHLSNSHKWIMP